MNLRVVFILFNLDRTRMHTFPQYISSRHWEELLKNSKSIVNKSVELVKFNDKKHGFLMKISTFSGQNQKTKVREKLKTSTEKHLHFINICKMLEITSIFTLELQVKFLQKSVFKKNSFRFLSRSDSSFDHSGWNLLFLLL